MSANPLISLMNADLNSDRNRAIFKLLCHSIGGVIIRLFPARATACYGGLLAGFALAFAPIAKGVPTKLTLTTTLIGAGLIAVAAHELDELQDELDEQRERRVQERELRLFAETEAKSKQTETQLLRHGYALEKTLPVELRQTNAQPAAQPAAQSAAPDTAVSLDSSRAAFDAAVDAAQGSAPAPTKTAAAPTDKAPAAKVYSFTQTMEQIAQKMISLTLIGVPGAGKGMFVSHLLRLARKHHPQLTIFVMEGKGDAKERGYWEGVANQLHSIKGLESSPVDIVAWVNGCLEDSKKISGPKLLVFDEVTYIYKVWQKTEKEGFEDYIQYKVGLSSMGDSLENYIWEIGQVSNAKDLGVSGGIRALFKPIAIVSNHDRRAANALLGTKFVPLPEEGKRAVLTMCDASPCGRAIYDYINDCWQPMPQLANLSGFDRDTRSFTPVASSPSSAPAAPAQSDVVASLERLLSVEAAEPERANKRFGLTAAQIEEVQKRLSTLQPGSISSIKRIRENSRLLREEGIKQTDLSELFDYLAKTKAISWLAGDKKAFQYIGGL